MKKILFLIMLSILTINVSQASKLSKYFKERENEERAMENREWRKDMDFANYDFRLKRRYNDGGRSCRDYVVKSRINPFRKGFYTMCER